MCILKYSQLAPTPSLWSSSLALPHAKSIQDLLMNSLLLMPALNRAKSTWAQAVTHAKSTCRGPGFLRQGALPVGRQQLAVLGAGSPRARKSRVWQWLGPAAPCLDVGTGIYARDRHRVGFPRTHAWDSGSGWPWPASSGESGVF